MQNCLCRKSGLQSLMMTSACFWGFANKMKSLPSVIRGLVTVAERVRGSESNKQPYELHGFPTYREGRSEYVYIYESFNKVVSSNLRWLIKLITSIRVMWRAFSSSVVSKALNCSGISIINRITLRTNPTIGLHWLNTLQRVVRTENQLLNRIIFLLPTLFTLFLVVR